MSGNSVFLDSALQMTNTSLQIRHMIYRNLNICGSFADSRGLKCNGKKSLVMNFGKLSDVN